MEEDIQLNGDHRDGDAGADDRDGDHRTRKSTQGGSRKKSDRDGEHRSGRRSTRDRRR